MGKIIYEPLRQIAMAGVQLEIPNNIPNNIGMMPDRSWITELANAIGREVEIAIRNSIQEHIVIPLKIFLITSWKTFMVISRWGCIVGFIYGGYVYMMGDEVKGKKIAIGSIIFQIVVQMLNIIFLG